MPKTKYPIFKWLHRGEKGVTLIELLIVLAILGILVAVLVPNVSKFMGRGECEAYCLEKSTLQEAALAYITDTGGSDGGTVANLDGYYTGKLKWYTTADTFDVNGVLTSGPSKKSKPDGCNCTGV